MTKKYLVYLSAILFAIQFSGTSYASLREKVIQADKNKDGKVDRKELHMEKKERRLWKLERRRVNTTLESKYDKNGDGWLEADESRELLRDRWNIIHTSGKAKVDSAIEAVYDTNKDGVIDEKEAESLKEDLK